MAEFEGFDEGGEDWDWIRRYAWTNEDMGF